MEKKTQGLEPKVNSNNSSIGVTTGGLTSGRKSTRGIGPMQRAFRAFLITRFNGCCHVSFHETLAEFSSMGYIPGNKTLADLKKMYFDFSMSQNSFCHE